MNSHDDLQKQIWRNRTSDLVSQLAPSTLEFFDKIRRILLIVSSSRGGSSIFSEILRNSDELLHFQAEINPFLNLAGLTFPESGRSSDLLDAQDLIRHQERIALIERAMWLDLGQPDNRSGEDSDLIEDYCQNLHLRLHYQWPDLVIDRSTVDRAIELAAEKTAGLNYRPGPLTDNLTPFHLNVLKLLHEAHPPIDPHRYDLAPREIEEYFPGLKVDPAPALNFYVEEPPFVTIRPWRRANPADLKKKPLVIKTPSNAYRLEFLKRLFPNAEIQILHLTRNPAAAINGLYDGWRYHGFFSHKIPVSLDIKGYSDCFPDWAQAWWKFDLPPGWEGKTGSILEEVCAFQWYSAHKALDDFLQHNRTNVLRLRFENVIGPIDLRIAAIRQLCSWLDIDDEVLTRIIVQDIAPVMATAKPRQKRWFDRAAQLDPVLRHRAIKEMAAHLGYRSDRTDWF